MKDPWEKKFIWQNKLVKNAKSPLIHAESCHFYEKDTIFFPIQVYCSSPPFNSNTKVKLEIEYC